MVETLQGDFRERGEWGSKVQGAGSMGTDLGTSHTITLTELQEIQAASQDFIEFMQVQWRNETRSTNTPIKTGGFKARSCKQPVLLVS